MMKSLLAALLFTVLASSGAVAAPTSLSGVLVNAATWVTGDANASTLNMGAMMGANGGMPSGYGSGMMGGASGNGGYAYMSSCRSALGLVTSDGQFYLIAVESPAYDTFSLCREVGSRVTLRGQSFSKGGMNVLLLDSAQ